MIGESLGAYRVEREIGAGGMGTVYAALVDRPVAGLEPGTAVALKVVHPRLLESADAVVRFRREVEIGASVDHANVVRTLDGGRSDGRHFLVMELLEGQTLAELQQELTRVPEELCRHIGREVASGLAAIHAAGVVHRDVKPENVLITPDHVVKIMDLGVARVMDEAIRLSRTGAFVGSLQYAAPESFNPELGPEDHRADLHALGLVLYELATGDAPYAAPDVHGAIRLVLDAMPRRLGELNPQVSPFFEDVVHTLLLKEPRGRFASAEELRRVLEQGENGGWWRSRAVALRAETRRPLRRIRIPRETAIVGRDDELARLESCFARACAGEGQVVLLEGEAGVGKSRLVDELVLRLERSGADINFLFGSYPPGGAATASGAFSTAYREQFGDGGSAEYLSETPLLVPAFDALLRGDARPAAAEPLTKGSLQTCFVHATRALAAERTTVVLVDDLHYAPAEGRALFAALAAALPGHRVLLIGTTRRGLSKDWVAGITRFDHLTSLQLDRLGPKDLYQLLHQALRSEHLADRLAGQIGLKSDGNPFFVFEILRGLREGQFITCTDDGSWKSTARIDDIQIPASVVELIEARVADLTEEERELLEVAACFGFEFDGTLVADALGAARIPTFRRLGKMEKQHRLVRASGRLHVFDHHQVRDVLYEGMSVVLREAYHAAFATALQARCGGADVDPADIDGATCVLLCRHGFLGRFPELAARYLDRATGHLQGGHLYELCVELADTALGEPGLIAGVRRSQLLRSKAGWLSYYRRADEQVAALEASLEIAERIDDRRELIRSHKALGNHYAHVVDPAAAERHLRRALELAESGDDRPLEGVTANALATALYFHSEFAEARPLFRRHILIAREAGDRRQEARAHCNLGLVHLAESRYDEARERFQRTYELATEAGDRRGQSIAVSNLGGIAYNMGLWAEAQDAFERDLAVVRELGDRRSETVVVGNLAVAIRAQGHLADAERWSIRYLDLAEEMGDPRAAASARGKLGTLSVIYGDLEFATALLEGGIASADELGDRRTAAWGHRRVGGLRLAEERPREAAAAFARAIEPARELGLRGLLAEALCEGTSAQVLIGDDDSAREMLAECTALAREMGSPEWAVLGACRQALLGVGEATAAPAAFDEHESRLPVVSRTHARYLLWRLTGDHTHLSAARELVELLCAHAPEERREAMTTNHPLFRAVLAGDSAAAVA